MGFREVYRASGKLGSALWFLPFWGILGGVLLGCVYAYINVWNPLVYFTILATLGMGYLLGLMAVRGAVQAKCRCPIFAAAMGTWAGFCGLYFAWATFAFALLQRQGGSGSLGLVFWITNPGALWEFMTLLNQSGWFTIGKGGSNAAPVNGIFLSAAWLIEAGILLGVPAYIVWDRMKKKVFCEDCGVWCQEKDAVAKLEGPAGTVEARLKEGDLEAMLSLSPLAQTAETAHYFRVDQRLCPRCGNMGTYQIQQVITTLDKNNKPSTSVEPLSGKVLLTPQTVRELGALLSYVEKPPAPPAEAPENPPAPDPDVPLAITPDPGMEPKA